MKLTFKAIFFLFSLVLVVSPLWAEYRVYQYVVKARNPFSMDQNGHVVTSTLDPQSYLAYHGGSESIVVDLLRSWMCTGDTSFKKTCFPPIARGVDQEATN